MGHTLVDTRIVSVVGNAVFLEAGQSVTVEGQAAVLAVPVVRGGNV